MIFGKYTAFPQGSIEPQRLKILLDKIVERQETLREVKTLRRQLREQGTFGSIIGNSPLMRSISACFLARSFSIFSAFLRSSSAFFASILSASAWRFAFAAARFSRTRRDWTR